MGRAAQAVVSTAGTIARSGAVRKGGAAGLLGAALLAGALVERRIIRRHRLLPDLPPEERLGPVEGRVTTVLASDGVPLHVVESGPEDAALTIVFAHGFCVSSDCWVFQQRGLGDLGRLVFYDQRAHGRSGPSDIAGCTIDQLADDLFQILAERVPTGPVVLVGHSMGGMAILGLAGAHPELFGDRVVGVALLATSAGELARLTFGLPAGVAAGVRKVLPGLAVGLRRAPSLLERARLRGSDLAWELTRRSGFGRTAVPPSVVSFLEKMIADTPIPVIASFLPTLFEHDKLAAAAGLRDVPTVLVVGDEDLLTPPQHSRTLAEVLPEAELIVEEGAGHAIILERPEAVNAAIRKLVTRAMPAAETPTATSAATPAETSAETSAETQPPAGTQPATETHPVMETQPVTETRPAIPQPATEAQPGPARSGATPSQSEPPQAESSQPDSSRSELPRSERRGA